MTDIEKQNIVMQGFLFHIFQVDKEIFILSHEKGLLQFLLLSKHGREESGIVVFLLATHMQEFTRS